MKRLFAHSPRKASWRISAIPLLSLAVILVLIILIEGPLAVSDYSPLALLGCSALALLLSVKHRYLTRRGLATGLRRSATQILPAIPMLICIAALATTWMLSGVVPTLVEYGLLMLNPQWFLVTACVACAMVSVITGQLMVYHSHHRCSFSRHRNSNGLQRRVDSRSYYLRCIFRR